MYDPGMLFDSPDHVNIDWRWPHFAPREFACKSTGFVLIQPRLLDALEEMRAKVGGPLVVFSGYRSAKHNTDVGGAKNSQHTYGKAADIRAEPHGVDRLIAAARSIDEIRGIGRYGSFVHVDVRSGPRREWGT